MITINLTEPRDQRNSCSWQSKHNIASDGCNFHTENKGKNADMQSDLHSDLRKWRKYDPFNHILRI